MTRARPLTNAERQARRRKFSDRPIMGVTVSRWVQAAVAEQAESRGVTMSENVEEALESFAGAARLHTLTLTERGASILGCCTACKRELRAGDLVRRDGEFARHEGCQTPAAETTATCGALWGGHACTEPVDHKGRYHVHREGTKNIERWPRP